MAFGRNRRKPATEKSISDSSQIPITELRHLNKHHIYFRNNKSKLPFICQVCNTWLPSLGTSIQHSKQVAHNDNLLVEQVKSVLYYLPPITEAHRIKLTATLEEFTARVEVTPFELNRRREFADQVMSVLHARFSDIEVIGIGSTWHGVVLYDSDVNMNVCRLKPNASTSDVKERYPSGRSCDEAIRSQGGPGYLLSHVHDYLASVAKDRVPPPQPTRTELREREDNDISTEQPSPLDVIHSIQVGDAEFFYIAFKDDRWVTYRITTGCPHGSFHALLVATYLSLNPQVVQLVTLLRFFFKYSYLDLPLNGTFFATVVPVMVIFYAQHCRPNPLLPNLHQLYRDNRAAVPQEAITEVIVNGEDLSFIHDKQVIMDLWEASKENQIPCPSQGDDIAPADSSPPAEAEPTEGGEEDDKSVCSCSTEQGTTANPSLADLWLGLLRFYLFDFMKNRFQVNIVNSNPVNIKHYFRNTLSISDPFRSGHDLCSNIVAGGFEFIWAQMLSAYGYFGVPRLALNGRHLFTKVKIDDGSDRSRSSIAGTSGTDQSASGLPRGQDGGCTAATGPGEILVHLCPIIDDTQNYEDNFIKVYSRLAEGFAESVQAKRKPLNFSSSEATSTTTDKIDEVELFTILPKMLKVILDEVLDSEEVPSVVVKCMARNKVCPPRFRETQLTVHQFDKIMRNVATLLWDSLLSTFIRIGKLTIPESWIVNNLVASSRKVILFFLPKMCMNEDSFEAEQLTGSTADAMPLHKSSSMPNKADQPEATVSPDLVQDASEDDIDDDDDEDVDLEDIDLRDVTAEESYLGLNRSLPSSDDINHKGGMLHANGTMDDEPHLHGDDGASDFAEMSLDLGGDDESGMELVSTDRPDVVHEEYGDSNSLLSQAMDLIPGTASTVEDDASNIPGDGSSLLSGESHDRKLVGSTPVKHTCASSSAPVALKRSSEPTETAPLSSTVPGQSESVATESVGAGASKKVKTSAKERKPASSAAAAGPARWDVVILTREALGPPVDDLRLGYYSSEAVKGLKPDDLAFPFTPGGSLPPPGCDHIVSYVLGIGASGLSLKTSSMIAHFSPPKQQCNACGGVGHRISSCSVTSDKSVSFAAWQKMADLVTQSPSDEHLAALSDCLLELARLHDPTAMHQQRASIQNFLLHIFQRHFGSVNLELFGSCANGFELPSSDMDICVFFPTNSRWWRDMQNIKTSIPLMRSFGRLLCSHEFVHLVERIRSILHAKVPILKVRFWPGIEADISFSNYLAMINTRMLKMYVLLEPRLRPLGVALKVIAKLYHIGNPSMGGISSYGYVLMLIHYMQQKNQLPVLQEMYEDSEKPENIIYGWNAWYQDDISVVDRLWKRPQQRTHLADLWLGFFRYYLFEFNRDLNVVTIRQKPILTRFVKMWTSLFAVEDPFNLDHNLTGALTRGMLLYVLDVFNAVLVHHTTLLPINMSIATWRYSLFEPTQLDKQRRRPPPTRLHCLRCDLMGHKSIECPSKKRVADIPRPETVCVREADMDKSLISGLLIQNSVASGQAQMPAPAPPATLPPATPYSLVRNTFTSNRHWTPPSGAPRFTNQLPGNFLPPAVNLLPINPPQQSQYHSGICPQVPQPTVHRQPGGPIQTPCRLPRWPNNYHREPVGRPPTPQQAQWAQNRQNYQDHFPQAGQISGGLGGGHQRHGRGFSQNQRFPQPPTTKSKGSSPGITHQRQPAPATQPPVSTEHQQWARGDTSRAGRSARGSSRVRGDRGAKSSTVPQAPQPSAAAVLPSNDLQRNSTVNTNNHHQKQVSVSSRKGHGARGTRGYRRAGQNGAPLTQCSSARSTVLETDNLAAQLHRLPSPSA